MKLSIHTPPSNVTTLGNITPGHAFKLVEPEARNDSVYVLVHSREDTTGNCVRIGGTTDPAIALGHGLCSIPVTRPVIPATAMEVVFPA